PGDVRDLPWPRDALPPARRDCRAHPLPRRAESPPAGTGPAGGRRARARRAHRRRRRRAPVLVLLLVPSTPDLPLHHAGRAPRTGRARTPSGARPLGGLRRVVRGRARRRRGARRGPGRGEPGVRSAPAARRGTRSAHRSSEPALRGGDRRRPPPAPPAAPALLAQVSLALLPSDRSAE